VAGDTHERFAAARTEEPARHREQEYPLVISRRRLLYWLAVMIVVLVVGTIIGLIWADTSDVAGSIAVATNIVGVVGIVTLLIALGITTRRQRHLHGELKPLE